MYGSYAQGSLLGQSAPSVTTAVALFTATMPTEIMLLLAVVDTGTPTLRVYHDVNGTTYALANEIHRQAASGVGGITLFQAQCPGGGIMLEPGDSIGVQTSVANAAVFSMYGITANLADRVRGLG